MADTVTISDPRTVELIRKLADIKTGGDATRAVELATWAMLEAEQRVPREGTLFGGGKGMVTFIDDVDLTEPMFSEEEIESWDMSTGAELMHGQDRAAE